MAVLRGKDAIQIDKELQELEAKVKEARERKEQLAVKQHEVVGRIVLGLVSSGHWTESQLHDLLRPHIKRAKDFTLLGISRNASTTGDDVNVDETPRESERDGTFVEDETEPPGTAIS